MAQGTASFAGRLSRLLKVIYPDLDSEILASNVVEAFWPEGNHRRKRPRTPGKVAHLQHRFAVTAPPPGR